MTLNSLDLIRLATTLCASTCLAQGNVSRGVRYQIRTANTLTISLPIGDVQGEHMYQDGAGKWLKLPNAKFADGTLTFTLSPEQLREGSTTLLVGKPAWLDLNDDAPPAIAKALVDGKPVERSGEISLGWIDQPPLRFEIHVADQRNPLDPESVRAVVNGKDLRPDGKALRYEVATADTKKARLVCAIPELMRDVPQGTTRITLECDDYAPDGRRASITLLFTVTRPPEIKLGKPAAATPDGRKIFVESMFAGYENVECVLDGKLQQPGSSTVGCSWASVESENDHWICLVLPKPREVAGVKIDWPNWKNTYWTSSRYDIMTWDGKEWQRALRAQANAADKASTHKFAPCTTDRVLIWQPSMGGHPQYQDIMWMTEVTLLP